MIGTLEKGEMIIITEEDRNRRKKGMISQEVFDELHRRQPGLARIVWALELGGLHGDQPLTRH